MANKTEKKKKKLLERIESMEDELLIALTKKTSDVREINVADHQRKINELKKELIELK